MVAFAGTFSRLTPRKVMVAGDFVLDRYTVGKARRISPEAPVAVLNVGSEDQRPGGAGNVALNLLSLGAQVVTVGRVGDDESGRLLQQSLSSDGVDVSGLATHRDMLTPVKNRIIADNQQIVRIDYETVTPIPSDEEKKVIATLPALFNGVDIVAISDYGKGFLSPAILEAIIATARRRDIPVITDPKGTDFSKYRGSTIVKPNLSEAVAAAALGPEASLDQMAAQIHDRVLMDYLMVTRSQAGISVFPRQGERRDFPPLRAREVKDVTGAGDTVLATLTCAWANGLTIEEGSHLCNVAAGIAIERFGCARVTLSELAHRMLDLDSGNKIFGQEHLFALQEVLKGRNLSLIAVDTRQGFHLDIFKEIHKARHEAKHDVVVALQDPAPDQHFIAMLASLKEVSFIILNGQPVEALCRTLAPQSVLDLSMAVV